MNNSCGSFPHSLRSEPRSFLHFSWSTPPPPAFPTLGLGRWFRLRSLFGILGEAVASRHWPKIIECGEEWLKKYQSFIGYPIYIIYIYIWLVWQVVVETSWNICGKKPVLLYMIALPSSINELDCVFYPIIAASSEVSSAPWLENPPAILRYLAGPPIRRPAPLLLTDPGGSSPNGVNDFCKSQKDRDVKSYFWTVVNDCSIFLG